MIRGSVINHDLRRALTINSIQYLVCDIVAQYSFAGQICKAADIAEDLGLSPHVVSRAISELMGTDPRLIASESGGYTTTVAWKNATIMSNDIESARSSYRKMAEDVIKKFNETVGSSYKAETYVGDISAILRKDPSIGFRQFDAVIQHKNLEWSRDDKMRQYLRPATLFGSPGKFLRYLDEARNYWRNRDKTTAIM